MEFDFSKYDEMRDKLFWEMKTRRRLGSNPEMKVVFPFEFSETVPKEIQYSSEYGSINVRLFFSKELTGFDYIIFNDTDREQYQRGES